MQVTSQMNNAMLADSQVWDAGKLRHSSSSEPGKPAIGGPARDSAFGISGGLRTKDMNWLKSGDTRSNRPGPDDTQVRIKGDRATVDIDRGGKHWHLTGNATRNDDEGNVTHLHVSGLTYGFGPSGVAAG